MRNLLYRNPSTGLIEVKEFSDKAPYLMYVKDARGVLQKEPKEFAADAALGVLRIADPVLTSIAQGYAPQDGFVGNILFPTVPTDKESGRFPAFGKELRVLPGGDIKRAVGGAVQRMITTTGYIQLALSEYALGFNVENREINEWAGTSQQLLVSRQNAVNEKIALYREYLQAVLATTVGSYESASYAISGAGKLWATSGNPIVDMLQLIALVRKTNGQKVDTVWFTPTAWYLFCNNTNVINRIKYGGTPSAPADLYVAGEVAVAKLLGVSRVVIAWATYTYGTEGGFLQAAGTNAWLWESVNSACAGCCITGSGWGVPSFGYTYERKNSPIVESWYDNSVKSMKYDYEHFFDPAVTKADGGGMYYALA